MIATGSLGTHRRFPLLCIAIAAVCCLSAAAASAQTVYITKTGAKYHSAGCRYLSKSSISIDLADALARGYVACSVCNPPRSVASPAVQAEAPVADRASTPAAVQVQPRGREIWGVVVGVHDGDTLTLLVDLVQHKIRLNGIDAPELGQAWGQRAKQALSDLCFGQTERVVVVDTDRYGREVGDVYAGDLYLNLELVRAGMAWHYKQYSNDDRLAAAEISARMQRLGLWADAQPVAPWAYRKE